PWYVPFDSPAGRALSLYEKLVGLHATHSNQLDLLSEGTEAFERMFDAIRDATDYVLIHFFIVNNDELGKAFKALLAERAQAGIRIYFLFDDIGSRKLPGRYVRGLRKAGVHVYPFRSSRGRLTRLQINFRNHRKIVVVDGLTAFVSGYNIGDEYLGRVKRFGPWRDTGLQVTGPAVLSLQIPFMEDWHWITRENLKLSWHVPELKHPGHEVLVLPTGPADDLETCHLYYLQAIHSARERLWICSPYFVPDQALVSAIQLAALRGVDVRIMLPEKPDHLLVFLSSFSYFHELHQVGARVFRYQPGFMHQKVLLVDNKIAAVGSSNLDNRSCFLNFELNLLVANPAFIMEVKSMLRADFEQCREVVEDEMNQRNIGFQIMVRLARVLSPLQ
ncbi:MAG: cardiolipin synthase, partial [Verrucomicrobiales bacterium]